MKEKNLSLYIGLATMLISVGVAWGVVQTKVADVDKIKEKTEVVDKKVVALEVNVDDIKDITNEIKSDLKELIKSLRDK